MSETCRGRQGERYEGGEDDVEGYWIVRTYEAGNVGEKTKFFVPGARPTRSQRRLRDAARKQADRKSVV